MCFPGFSGYSGIFLTTFKSQEPVNYRGALQCESWAERKNASERKFILYLEMHGGVFDPRICEETPGNDDGGI